MDGEPNLGAKSVCGMCGAAIVFMGPYWDHMGENKPRHPATPKQEAQPPQWMAVLDERTNKHIAFACNYADRYAHGAPGHLDLMTIAALAKLLDARESRDDG